MKMPHLFNNHVADNQVQISEALDFLLSPSFSEIASGCEVSGVAH